MTVNNKDQSPAGNAPKQHLTKDEMREKIKRFSRCKRGNRISAVIAEAVF